MVKIRVEEETRISGVLFSVDSKDALNLLQFGERDDEKKKINQEGKKTNIIKFGASCFQFYCVCAFFFLIVEQNYFVVIVLYIFSKFSRCFNLFSFGCVRVRVNISR